MYRNISTKNTIYEFDIWQYILYISLESFFSFSYINITIWNVFKRLNILYLNSLYKNDIYWHMILLKNLDCSPFRTILFKVKQAWFIKLEWSHQKNKKLQKTNMTGRWKLDRRPEINLTSHTTEDGSPAV